MIKHTQLQRNAQNIHKNQYIRLKIEDNGKGMEKDKTIKGIGLRNINSRLSVFNGKMNINTSPGKGFALEIEIPLI